MFCRGIHIASSLNELRHTTRRALDFAPISELTFPNNDDLPARLPQFTNVARIPSPVGLNLVPPERRVRLWNVACFAPMAVPKAPVNENDCACSGKYDVWFARETSHVDAVTHSHPMKSSPKRQLWCCVT
jgi:hypothetical protein